jgi:hypothetical protein
MSLLPRCPRCGSYDGVLGTSYAYFICRTCAGEDDCCVYWTPDYSHPIDWAAAIAASPWAQARQQLENLHPFSPQPTVEECAAVIMDAAMTRLHQAIVRNPVPPDPIQTC